MSLRFAVMLAVAVCTYSGVTPCCRAASIDVELQLTDSQIYQGQLTSIDRDKVQVVVDGESLTLATAKVATIKIAGQSRRGANNQDRPPARFFLKMVDGGYLRSVDLQIAGETVFATVGNQTRISIPKSNFRWIALSDVENDSGFREQWDELIKENAATSDVIVTQKNGALQPIEGRVGDLDDAGLQFSIENRTAKVKLDRIKGVLFYRATRELADSVCRVRLVDRSRLEILRIAIKDRQFELTTVDGTELKLDQSQIDRLDFSASRAVYLSDLLPTSNDWKPLLASDSIAEKLKPLRIARIDQSFSGTPLTLQVASEKGLDYQFRTDSFAKGFAMAGGGRLVFTLNRQFKQLTGRVGFDPLADPSGRVKFSVQIDGKTVVSNVLEAANLRDPLRLKLDLSTANRMVFKVDYYDGRSIGDVLHLADFQVSR